ncbi:MAG: LLM class flavin-dependent oxidoreductase [Actinomycetota bacterium]|nr:LLM class flavin-dependent oxidoreductase [Actinomycetota bacterium]
MDISCAFATSMSTPEHVELAEELGYRRAWLYDSPALYPEVFMTLARCAERTTSIGIGTGVLIPSLRHPMTAAASIATLADLAPGRVEIGVGSGFTGRLTLGQKPLPWATVADYVRCVQALLRGEQTQWEGATIQMLHPEGFGARRPVEVPWIVGCEGPKGQAAAHELGEGAFSPLPLAGFDRMVQLTFGTVLDDSEDPGSDRAMAAAGHGAAVILHGSYERGIPFDPAWSAEIDAVPADIRHLAIHDRHLVSLTERDRPYVTGDLIAAFTTTGTAREIRDRVAAARDAGVTEVAYQPAGPDIPRELAAFHGAVSGL